METSYVGRCVIKLNGVITDIQVEDQAGNSIPLPIDEYLKRNISPNHISLPECCNTLIGSKELCNINTTYAVSETTLVYQGEECTIKQAGINEGKAYVELAPFNNDVAKVIIEHIEANFDTSISLTEIQDKLNNA